MIIHAAGTGALLLDAACGPFSEAVQHRIWATARTLGADPEVTSALPGINNLLLRFDPLKTDPEALEMRLASIWGHASAQHITGRTHVLPVRYDGEDLAEVATHTGLAIEEVIAAHLGSVLRVAAIGAMPGFPYLTGLDARLSLPRRMSPRLSVSGGAVVIAGGMSGIMPCTAPTGWHILGRTTARLFDAASSSPCLLASGDVVRFERMS